LGNWKDFIEVMLRK
ncbi:TPA: protein YpfM, partial [Escherichia coli]|nr:protein YpfM [Salmonella enterica]EGT9556313.1 protein YpfM [Salmonella enterica]EKR2597496.1 protein YpfM [Salmonella enterica subsp. enterica serovar Typhi]HAY4468855.1 protein YpfM [Escherichia coli]HDI5835378.1 protein YpfM [Escherichia coli]